MKSPTVLFLLLILAAYLLPRAYLYRGIPITTNFTFADMIYHVHHIDIETKKRLLPAAQLDDPYIKQFTELTTRIHPYRWPGLVYAMTVPWAALFGALSIWTIQTANFVFMMILVLAVIGLGSAMGSLRLGLWAALLTVLLPPIFASTWYYSLDYPLVGFSMMGLYLLWRTDRFTRPLATVLFAVWSGLGIYVKFTYALYLLVPALAAGLAGLVSKQRRRTLALAPLALGIGLGMFVLAFQPTVEEIWGEFYNHAFSRELPAAAIPPLSKEWWLSQPIFASLNYPMGLLLLAVPGLVLYPFWRLGPRHMPRVLLLCYLWGSVANLTLMVNKLERYLHPVYPALCLLTAWWVFSVLPERFRKVTAIACTLAFAAVLTYTQLDPTPWNTGTDNAKPSAAMWNEYAMPGLQRLNVQRQDPYFSHCHFKPLVDQIVAWAEADPRKRPVGMAHVRSTNSGGKEAPFGELLLLVAYRLQDRFVVSGGLYGMERLPGPLGQAPNLVIIHPNDEDPRAIHPELSLRKRKAFRIRCRRTNPEFTLSLYHNL